jgi:cobalt-precorrin 5A hydrolase
MTRQVTSRIVAIGVGCRAGVAGEPIAALARRAPGLIEAARIIGIALTPLPLAALNAQAEGILTPSAAAQARFGAPNIAEAAALAGAGVGGRLLGPRLAAHGATCAIALSPERQCDGATCAVALPPEQE